MREHAPLRHPRSRLTDRTVASTNTPGRYADGEGLYLLVGPTGAKSWVLRVKIHQGKREDMGLGSVEPTPLSEAQRVARASSTVPVHTWRKLTLSEARDSAREWRKYAKAGESPSKVRRTLVEREAIHKAIPTFEQAAKQYHALHSPTFRNEKHREQWLSSLDPVFTAFGAKRIDEVRSSDLIAALESRWIATPETARRVLQRVRAVFERARGMQFVNDNPTRGLERVFPQNRKAPAHHAALPYADLPKFVEGLRASDAGLVVQLAFEFLILTAARTSEVLNATWSEFDLKGKTWTIPAERMKAKIEHRVPLSPRCVEILKQAQGLSNDGSFAFPGRLRSKPLSNMAFLMALRRMGHESYTAHGFRSTFRDWVEERTHTPHAVAEAALAHTVKNKTEAAYRRSDLFDKRRDLMNAWATFAITKPKAGA